MIQNLSEQVIARVMQTPIDPENAELQELQRTQNKMVRFLNSKTLADRCSTKELVENLNMLSVNQLNAKIKLQEIWKAINLPDYPLKIEKKSISVDTL